MSQAKPESVEVAKYACDLVIEECWKEIQSNKEKDDKKLPTAGGRRIPSPLQDTTEDLPPEMEQSPEATAPQLWPQTPQSPVAPPAMVHYIDYMPAPPTFADTFNAGFAAGFANTMGGMGGQAQHLGSLGSLGFGPPGLHLPCLAPHAAGGPHPWQRRLRQPSSPLHRRVWGIQLLRSLQIQCLAGRMELGSITVTRTM